MLKEVGASGQISLGRKFAGQLFDVQFLETGVVQMLPVRVVPATSEPEQSAARKLSRPPQTVSPARQEQWERENAQAIAAFNQRMDQMGSPAQRLHAWRESQKTQAPAQANADSVSVHGAI